MSCCCSGDVRNDIYITVESGVFEKGNKRSERNVEVAIDVFDGSKNAIPVSPACRILLNYTSLFVLMILYQMY